MADRTITLRVGADVTDAQSKLRTLAQTTQQWATKNEQHINTLSNSLGKVGLAVTAVAGLAVKRFADFDAAMSAVGAATMETRENMGLLREAAIEAGADTQYSATEAAQGVEELAKAGVSTADILKGGLAGALNLAASGAIGVGDAAEIAATALTQFRLDGNQTAHVADLLAAGAGKAQGGVGDLGMALKQAGLVANSTGLTIEETTAGLTAFAKAGLVGSDAGTSFKAMLQRLTPQSQEAQQEMDRLGISAYDSQGNFIGLAEFAGNLRDALKDLTPEQRNAAQATIFGSDAVRASNILYEQGEAGIRGWIEAVNDQGYAAEQAQIRTDNLRGDIERLGGSLDTVFIKGGAGANDALRTLVQGTEAVVDAIGRIPEPVLSATTLIAGAGGLSLLAVAGLGKIVVAVNNVRTALILMNVSTKAATLTAGALGAVVAIGTLAFANWATKQAEAKQRVDDLKASLDQATGAVTDFTRKTVYDALVSNGTIDKAKALGIVLDDLVDAAIDPASDAFARVKEQTDSYTLASDTAVEALKEQRAGHTEVTQAASDAKDVIQALTGQTGEITKAQEAWSDAQKAGVGTSEDAAAAASDFADALADTNMSVVDQTEAIADLISAQSDLAGVVLSQRAAQRQLEAAIDDATESVKENGRTLDVTTEKGRANGQALDDIASASWDLIESMQTNGATQSELQSTMESSRQAFIDAATAMGMSADEATALADELNLIPTNIQSKIAVDDEEARRRIDALKAAVATIPTGVVNIETVGWKETYAYLTATQDAINAINGTKVRVAMGAGGQGGTTFATGGYTGDLPTQAAAGIVHGREFVINAAATARHRPLLEAINAGAPGYAAGGYVQPQPMPASSVPGIDYDRLAAAIRSQGGPSLTVGQMVTADPRAAVREMQSELALSWAGVPR